MNQNTKTRLLELGKEAAALFMWATIVILAAVTVGVIAGTVAFGATFAYDTLHTIFTAGAWPL